MPGNPHPMPWMLFNLSVMDQKIPARLATIKFHDSILEKKGPKPPPYLYLPSGISPLGFFAGFFFVAMASSFF
jgi:hypothetical protein